MKSMPVGKGLSNTQTKNSSGVVSQSGSVARGARKDPPGYSKLGKGLSGSQTANSSTVVKSGCGK